jgi:type IV pilus assembly protein PilQ
MKTHKYRKITLSIVCAIIIGLNFGCSTTDKKTDKKDDSHLFFDEWKARAQKSKGFSPSKTKRAKESTVKQPDAGPPEQLMVDSERPLPNQKITMKMKDIDVAVLLRALSRVARQNIMVSDKVTGKININITQAPWSQVFRSILRTQGLTYAWEGQIIRVMTVEDMETELKRESQRRELVNVQPLETRIIQVNYAEAAGLQKNLEKFLSSNREGAKIGSVMVDNHTNSIIIQAIRSDITKIAAVIERLDRPTSQILIEAHIVETTSDTARELGIQWGGLWKGSSGDQNLWLGPGVSAGDDDSLFTDRNDPNPGEPIEFLPPFGNMFNFPANLEGGAGMSVGFLFQDIGNMVLNMQLQALEQEGRLNILSSPSITTLENQAAIIESGSKVPIQTVEDGEVNIEYVDAVLKLQVTPHAINNETLKLKILTNQDEVDFTRTVAGNPTILTKKAETTVVVFNGQTTVIGGLSKETATKFESGVPYLKDIPGLGWLFRSKSKSKDMQEVLIFITPHVLEEKSDKSNPAPTEKSKWIKDLLPDNIGKAEVIKK